MIDMILRESIEKYNPNLWLLNGPGAVIRAIQRICKVDNPKALDLMRPEFCNGLMISPRTVFFPLDPQEAFKTDPQIVEEAFKKITNETVGIHLWTSQTRDIDILKSGPPMLYTIMAKKFCPDSYEVSGLHFN
ncbi:uncharacterized protein LOC116350382 [Contarinia nasturtii]|uniref:uncharacterized protein LOC116350382 n=1 Tax=Contarinia nasturtii TaxID=265458 RepID=UPI0012D479F8|nr:uncharacterized protein LOC116350382 [Contarinia nasturtii]